MSRNTDNEMARIQRGLEKFLEQEMASETEGREKKKSNSRREPQLYDLEEDWDRHSVKQSGPKRGRKKRQAVPEKKEISRKRI